MCELGKISFAELFWISYMSLNEVQGVLMITLCNGKHVAADKKQAVYIIGAKGFTYARRKRLIFYPRG